MKTKKTQLIDERVVRHIARKHYGMTFCEEYAMHQRNRGEITSWPATLAVIMTLVCAIGPFMLNGENQMIASVFGIIFGLAFLYCAIMLCVQEKRHNGQWNKILPSLNMFKNMIVGYCAEPILNKRAERYFAHNPGWKELVETAQDIMQGIADEVLRGEGILKNLNSSPEPLLRNLKGDALRRVTDGRKELLAISKNVFEDLFGLAKWALGDALDNGHGFRAFLKN